MGPGAQGVLGHTRLGPTKSLILMPILIECMQSVRLRSQPKYDKPSVLRWCEKVLLFRIYFEF